MQIQKVCVGQAQFLRVASKCFNQPYKTQKITDVEEVFNENGNVKIPEEPTTCCMSGCTNCVWIDYAEKLSTLLGSAGSQRAKELILERVSDPNVKAYLLMELQILQNRQS